MRVIVRMSYRRRVSPIFGFWLLLLWPLDFGIRFYAWGIVAMFRLMAMFVVYLFQAATTPRPRYTYLGRHVR